MVWLLLGLFLAKAVFHATLLPAKLHEKGVDKQLQGGAEWYFLALFCEEYLPKNEKSEIETLVVLL